VSQQLSLAYDRRQIILDRSELADKLAGQYVEVYDFTDRSRCAGRGHSLPYRVFSEDQRVSHTAVVENKRLSDALTVVKAQQQVKRVTAALANSALLKSTVASKRSRSRTRNTGTMTFCPM